MALKVKKFEKMIRGDSIVEHESYEKETINIIKQNELESLKQRILINSLSNIKDNELREKCSDVITHYRLFKNDELYFQIKELSDHEKDKLIKNINECINAECSKIINEKECIPTDLLKLIESEQIMPQTLKNKLNNLLFLLNKYNDNKKDINASILKLLDSSYINILESQQLSEQVDVVKANSYKFQSDIINKFSCSEELLKLLETYYNNKEKEYKRHLDKLHDLQKLNEKYKQVDGPQYKALVKKFIQTKEIIKIKTEMLNSY